MSIHQAPSLGDYGTRVSADHVLTTLRDIDYESARLTLNQQPAGNYVTRVNQFLSYPVKGRSLEQLERDYAELAAGTEGEIKKMLKTSYLVGWSHHDASGVLDWVTDNIEDQSKRHTIYQAIIAKQTDKIMDLMLARHGEADYETMMQALAGSNWVLTPEQKERFQSANRSTSASILAQKHANFSIENGKRISLKYPTSLLFEYKEGTTDLIIPRP